MLANLSRHLRVSQLQRLVESNSVVGEVVREQKIKLCFCVIIVHLVEEFHGPSAGTIARGKA